jgi:hypothetical protein
MRIFNKQLAKLVEINVIFNALLKLCCHTFVLRRRHVRILSLFS